MLDPYTLVTTDDGYIGIVGQREVDLETNKTTRILVYLGNGLACWYDREDQLKPVPFKTNGNSPQAQFIEMVNAQRTQFDKSEKQARSLRRETQR